MAHFSITQNPILSSEFRYQRFVINNSRSGRFWIFLAILLVGPSLLLSLGYSIGVLLNLFPVLTWQRIPQTPHLNLLLLLVVVNVSMYTVVTLVTIALSNRSIKREKDKHTWSLLRMTEINGTQIVLGKWWASLWALNGDHAMVILLRVGLLAIYLGIFLPSNHALDSIVAPYRLYFVVLMPFIILHGFLDAALSAILGLVGAIPDDALQTVTTFTVMVSRLAISIAVGVWFWQVLMLTGSDILAALRLAAMGIMMTVLILALCLFAAQWLVEHY